MKLFKLAPIAGLLIASSAFAVPEPIADIKIYAAGASAQLNTISGILTSLCKPNVVGGSQIEYYHGYGDASGNTSTSVNGNLRAFRCELANNVTSPSLNGKTVLFAYSAIDGSASGVQFLARQNTRKFINFDACPSTAATTGLVSTSVTPANSIQYNCNGSGAGTTSTVTTQDKAPSAGASDVEPAVFNNADNTPAGQTPITATDLAKLVVKPGRAVIFGVYANEAMWLELQKRQGLIPLSATAPIMPFTTAVSGTNNTLTNTPNGAFTEALRPNISKPEYRAIAQGALTDMASLSGTTSPVATSLTAGPLELARRVNGSGTQAGSNILFLNNPCGTFTSSTLTPADTDNFGLSVTLGSGTGNVIARFQANTTKPTIGIISLENPSRGAYTNTTGTDLAPKAGFAALKLDGVTPSRVNAINGTYEYVFEETIQWNKNVITAGSLAETFMNRFVDAGASIATLQTLTAATQEGSAALADYNGGVPSANTTWIMNSTRAGNNCAPLNRIIE